MDRLRAVRPLCSGLLEHLASIRLQAETMHANAVLGMHTGEPYAALAVSLSVLHGAIEQLADIEKLTEPQLRNAIDVALGGDGMSPTTGDA